MSDILYWNEARKELDENKLLSKCDTFVDSLMANGIAYPHTFNMNMDNVVGKTFDGLRREMNRLYKLFTKKLKDITPLTDEFQIHKGFLGKIKGVNDNTTYMPLVLLFDDGQILTGLAKRYEDGSYKVVKWFLNDEDVTKSIYGNKTRDILEDKNYNELAKRLAIIVNYNHKKFIRKNGNPIQKEIHELEKKKEKLLAKKEELLQKIEQLGNSAELSEKDRKKLIEEVAKTYLEAGENIGVDSGEGYIQDDLQYMANEMNIDISNEDLDELAKEVEDYIAENAEKYGMRYVNSQAYSNTPNYIEPIEVEELGESPKITAKNIAEFYPNMSDDELLNLEEGLQYTLDGYFLKRISIISEIINYRWVEDNTKYKLLVGNELQEKSEYNNQFLILGQTIFGVKDNLEPLDEYIAKIKASPEYQEYIRKNTSQDEEPTNEPQDNEIETKLKALLESDDPDYIKKEVDDIMDNMSDDEIDTYEDLLNKVYDKAQELKIKG